MKPSEMWEGENSSLKKAFDSVTREDRICNCHINPPCSYCTDETKQDESDSLRENAIRLDSGEMAKQWMNRNPGKCIFCKKLRDKCYC